MAATRDDELKVLVASGDDSRCDECGDGLTGRLLSLAAERRRQGASSPPTPCASPSATSAGRR